MKIHFIFWLIGGLLLISGMLVSISYFNAIYEKYPDLVTLIDEISLEPNQIISSSFFLSEGNKTTLSVFTNSDSRPVYFSLTDPKNSTSEIVFTSFLSETIQANSTGGYTLQIGNMGTQIIDVSTFLTEKPISEDSDFLLSLGTGFFVSSILFLIGIILIIIGVIGFIRFKNRVKNKMKKSRN